MRLRPLRCTFCCVGVDDASGDMRNLLVGEGADFTGLEGESGFFGCGEDVEACSSCGALHVGVLPSLLAAGHRAAGSLGLIEDVGLDFSFVGRATSNSCSCATLNCTSCNADEHHSPLGSQCSVNEPSLATSGSAMIHGVSTVRPMNVPT